MGRASDIFRKIMLGILLLIMSAALLLTAVNGITQHSYLIALLAGAVWAFILYRDAAVRGGEPCVGARRTHRAVQRL